MKPPALTITRRFSVLPRVQGWEVIDQDGRPVAVRSTDTEAAWDASTLNLAAIGGASALHYTLRGMPYASYPPDSETGDR